MGVFRPCLSVSGDSVELLEFELYDEVEAINVSPTNPGFDDLLGEPYLEDTITPPTIPGVGERVRPVQTVTLKGKIKFTKDEEQYQDQAGNAPRSFATVTVALKHLQSKGLWNVTTGEYGIRANDRLLRVRTRNGRLRVNFVEDGRAGVFVYEVRRGETGTGIVEIMLEARPNSTR